ncbi:AIPR family protein [Burkholderia sp. 22313]|uniref:AIPR family protein n=1 Tax=Burkholderia sp. 22313 TaxID=3453908 RepID=UPI003F850160
MNDLILQSYVDDYATRYDHADQAEHLKFEYFSAHCLVAEDYEGHFDAEELSVGDANGIDSVAIFINDTLVQSSTAVESLARQNMEARFLFVQTKTSASLDQGAVLKFTRAVRYFFSKDAKPADYSLGEWHKIKDAIYKNAIKFAENPSVELRYVSTSTSPPNRLMLETVDGELNLLSGTNLFSTVNLEFVNPEKLKALYRRLSNKITKQINFEKHTVLPKIQGVKRAYIGILPCKEYLELICDESGKLLRNVFYDNVRDYQGENSVNREILATLTADDASRQAFVLLNNGVTIVCKSINPVGSEFTVRDFQVVNGCQTSHVLHKNSDLLTDSEFVTVKLIETENVEIANKITKATNRQTEVKLEAFAGLQSFHKELEAFYAGTPILQRLYYERRPGQYDSDGSIKQTKVVTIPAQIQSFVSIFLEEPQKIHFYYGQLLKDYNEGNESVLFNETHDPYPYFMSSRLIYLTNERIRRGGKKFAKWRFHMATMIRMLIGGPFNKNRLSDPVYCKRYCDSMNTSLVDFDANFDIATGMLDKLLNEIPQSGSLRDLPQDKKLADDLIDECKRIYLSMNATSNEGAQQDLGAFDSVFVGAVDQLIPEKKFGFILYGQRRFFFSNPSASLVAKQRVRFKVRKSGDTVEAYDVDPIR